MSTLTSTLAIRVDDAGFAAKLRADAEAARQLGVNAQGLQKLKANAGTAGLVRQLDRLNATAGKVEGFQSASRALQALGAGHRAAREEVARTTAALAQAQRRKDFFDRSKAKASPNYPAFKASGMVAEADAALRKAARQHTAARRTFDRTQESFQAQKTNLRALGQELERTGVPLNQIAQVQAGLRTKIEQTTAAIRRQAAAHEDGRAAAAAHAAETTRRANAALRATVSGAEATRAQRAAAGRDAAAEERRQNRQAIRRTIEAGRRTRAEREEAVAAEAGRRANAGRDMARGMGAAGRRQAADIEGGRRVADGMSAPARQARERAAAQAAEAEEARAQARADQGQARKMLTGVGGLALGHKVRDETKEVLHVYREFDDLRRYQGAVADLTPEENKSRVKQALHLGAETRFNDLQVLEAQLDLAQRGVKKDFIEPFVGEVVNYSQAMNARLGEGAKTLEGIIFSTNQDVESSETALKVMRRQVDLAVKMAKIGGLNNDDVAQAFKFGGASGSGSGLSNETMATTFALLRRSGYTGSEAGVAQRAIAGKLVSPTMKGLDALDAMGVKWEDHAKIKRGAAPDLADNMMQRHFGKGLSKPQRTKMQDILEDEDVMGDRGKFVEAAVDAVADSFVQTTGKNKGKLAAKDRQSLAKKFGNFHKNLIESIDSEGLWEAIINASPTLAQANAWGTDKHGGKIMALARKAKEFKEYQEQLRHTPEGFAKDIGDKRNAGYAGAATRLEGSKKNLDSRIGQSLDNDGDGGFLTSITSTSATFVQALAELPNPILAAGASIAWLGGKVAETAGTALLVGASTGVATGIATGKGAAIAAGAAAAGTAGVGLGTLGIGVVAASIAAKQMPKIIEERGAAGLDMSTGFTPDANPMAGMAPDKPWAAEWLKKQLPSLFGQREGSLPPGAAGMPQAPLPRLPGLDGRPKAAVARPGDAAMLGGQTAGAGVAPAPITAPIGGSGALPQLTSQADQAKAKLAEVSAQTVTPQVDTSKIEAVAPKAAEAKAAVETLNVTARPTIDLASLQAAEAMADRVLAKLSQIGASAAGVSAAVRSIPAPGGNLRGRSSPSFSDGVTPGRGAE